VGATVTATPTATATEKGTSLVLPRATLIAAAIAPAAIGLASPAHADDNHTLFLSTIKHQRVTIVQFVGLAAGSGHPLHRAIHRRDPHPQRGPRCRDRCARRRAGAISRGHARPCPRNPLRDLTFRYQQTRSTGCSGPFRPCSGRDRNTFRSHSRSSAAFCLLAGDSGRFFRVPASHGEKIRPPRSRRKRAGHFATAPGYLLDLRRC
jgi:hypothetical protein